MSIPASHQFDLTQATLFGLNERLTSAATSPVINDAGNTLREQFNEEWERYADMMMHETLHEYGVYVYYKEKNHLVRYSDPYWHRVVSVASSSTLITDPEGTLSWKQVQDVFASTVIGVAGCSVGSNIIHNMVMDMRPRTIKIADKSVYKMENINRVKVAYWDLVKNNAEKAFPAELGLHNKAEVVARQLYAMDPFMDIHVYHNGVDEQNIDQFLSGGEHEPALDVMVEEIDDPRMKIFIREEARKRRIPLIMVTDAGSSVQLDVMRYDLDESVPLAHESEDHILHAAMEEVYDNPGSREAFFGFVDALIGTHYRQGELLKILQQECEIPTSTIIPQLGSTAAMGGAVVAEAIARIQLGHQYPRRMSFNKHTFELTVVH